MKLGPFINIANSNQIPKSNLQPHNSLIQTRRFPRNTKQSLDNNGMELNVECLVGEEDGVYGLIFEP